MEALFSDYEEVRKSGLFDAAYYLLSYPDVAQRNIDPLVHFLEEGAHQARNPHPDFDSGFYLEQCRSNGERPDNPLLHYIRVGRAQGLKTRRDPGDRDRGDRDPGDRDQGDRDRGDRDRGDRDLPQAPRPQAAGPAARAPVLVAIEALGVAGGPGGRSRLSVSGWALAAAPIVEITASLGAAVRASAAYGLARPDVAALYPDDAAAPRSGFILGCELPRGTGGTIEPVLSVRTADGEAGQRPLRVEIPPQQLAAPAAGERPDGPAMRLVIDRAAVDPGGILRVEGWLVCRVQIEAVDALLDGVAIGRVEFGRVRPDIEKICPDYPNARFAGFRLVSDVSRYGPGGKTLTIRASARAGVAQEAAAPVTIPERGGTGRAIPDPGFHYHCDEIALTPAGLLTLMGWAVGATPTEEVRVLLDGSEIGRAEIDLDRPEIGNLFPALPHARQPGFAFYAETGQSLRGQHVVSVHLRQADGQIRDVRLPVAAIPPGFARGIAVDGDPDRLLHIDSPEIDAGETPVRGNLQIAGWALAKAGVAEIAIAIDGKLAAHADYGLRRLDIRATHPDWADSLASGFTAVVPHRMLTTGRHIVSVTLRDKTGGSIFIEFDIDVDELSDAPGPWSLRRRMTPAEIDLDRRILKQGGRQPNFAAILPVKGEAAPDRAIATIASLLGQIYPNWRLFIVPQGAGGRPARLRERLLGGTAASDERIEVVADPSAVLANAAADTLFAVLAPGDELGVDAFLEMAIAVALNPDADFLYSDERCRNPATGTVEAFFKPQWSPDLMLSGNYVGRLWCARADLLASIADPGVLLGHGEYDLLLRCTETAKAVRHISAVLCERADGAIDGPLQTKRALARALARRGVAGEILTGAVPGCYRVKRALSEPGLVSIIIPTCAARGLIERCIATLRRLTAYRDYEIICIENIPPHDAQWRDWLGRNADRVISTTAPFNWSRFNNIAVAEARGRYLLFLNDDVEITDPDWLDVLLREAQRPEVGVVGPRLLYPDGRVQHAGMFLAAPGQGRHAFRYKAADDPGYFGLALTQRNVIAVTGACLMTRRATFDALGGFDEAQAIVNNDLDFCLRAWRHGLINVYTPEARLIHHEAVSRGALADDYDAATFDGKWRELFLAGDPYFSPHLSKTLDDLAIDYEPTRALLTGRPAMLRDDIRRILVLKLDHIGDCIIAFPALRRLKQHFPRAHIAVLTSRVSRPVWSLEPSVDETIEFDFFHPRSSEGEVERSDEDWQALRRRLAPERFDLAVDLRKHTETRPVLRHTGARHLAGFDFRSQFPWLDIALEWTGDQIYVRKRQHNGDDLVNLADAIAAACEGDRGLIAVRPAAVPLPAPLPAPLPEAGGSASGPLVCVHPGAGNAMKQWPVEYFAAVIDRLATNEGARIVLIGGEDDADVVAAILTRLRHRDRATSLVGQLSLAELPGLLETAALFLGNDSGPKHLAAALGVPTVGVHAGTVDVREWGPVGPNAIAVVREVVCSPCYLSSAEDCPRSLACLRELMPGPVYDACRRLLLLNAAVEPSPPAAPPPAAPPPTAPPPAARRRSTVRSAASARAASSSSS